MTSQDSRILAQLPIGITLTTFTGRVLNANPEARRLLEIAPETELGEVDARALYADPQERAQMVEDVKNDIRKRREVTLLVKGEPVLFRSMNVAFLSASGERGTILSAFWRV